MLRPMDWGTLAAACMVSALACTTLTWALFRSTAARERAANALNTAPPPADLAARVAALEAAFPGYQLEMANLVDQAQEMLGAAEKKRARAAAHASRVAKADEEQQAEQPALPIDRAGAKLAVLRRMGRA